MHVVNELKTSGGRGASLPVGKVLYTSLCASTCVYVCVCACVLRGKACTEGLGSGANPISNDHKFLAWPQWKGKGQNLMFAAHNFDHDFACRIRRYRNWFVSIVISCPFVYTRHFMIISPLPSDSQK